MLPAPEMVAAAFLRRLNGECSDACPELPPGRRDGVVRLVRVVFLRDSAGHRLGGHSGCGELDVFEHSSAGSLTYAPELVADTKGFFKAAGVNFQFVNGTPPAIAAIMSGRA